MTEQIILEWIKETCDAYCIPKPLAIIETLEAVRATAEKSRDSVIEQCAAICDKAEVAYNVAVRKETASFLALMIRALKSQQDAAIESKQAEQRSLGDVTGAMYRCRRCGETSEIQFNFATLPKEDSCCRQQPCVRPGKGPCDMPTRATAPNGMQDDFKEYRRGLMEAFHFANMIKANRQGRTAEETCAYIVSSLAALANGGAAIESQRSGDGS